MCLINFCLISLFFHYKVFTNENPLFCIIDTNSKEAFTYLDREPVNNVTYFEAMKARHKAFIWPSSSLEGPRKTTNESKDTHYRLFFVRSTYFLNNKPKIWRLILSDLQRFTQIALKFKTCKTCVLNFRTICVNLLKSDKLSRFILG